MENSIEQKKLFKGKSYRILMITRLHDGEGPTSVLLSLVPQLVRKGFTVDFLAVTNGKILNTNCENSKIVYATNEEIMSGKFKTNLADYDCYHFHGAFLWQFLFIRKYLAKNKKKYVITTHGNLMSNAIRYHSIRKKIYLNIFARHFFNGATIIHALSENEKKDILKIYRNANVVIIPNGIHSVDISSYHPQTNFFNIVFLGRIDVQHKGLDLLLEGFSKFIKENLDINVQLNIYGPYNTNEDEMFVKTWLKKQNCNNKIVIHPPVFGIDKMRILDQANLFIHTSRYEGMPMAVLEAMSRSVPVMVSEETNMAEIVKKANCGFITQLDVDNIAANINLILKMPIGELKSMGENGKLFAENYLNWEKLADDYVEMYRKVVEVQNGNADT